MKQINWWHFFTSRVFVAPFLVTDFAFHGLSLFQSSNVSNLDATMMVVATSQFCLPFHRRSSCTANAPVSSPRRNLSFSWHPRWRSCISRWPSQTCLAGRLKKSSKKGILGKKQHHGPPKTSCQFWRHVFVDLLRCFPRGRWAWRRLMVVWPSQIRRICWINKLKVIKNVTLPSSSKNPTACKCIPTYLWFIKRWR